MTEPGPRPLLPDCDAGCAVEFEHGDHHCIPPRAERDAREAELRAELAYIARLNTEDRLRGQRRGWIEQARKLRHCFDILDVIPENERDSALNATIVKLTELAELADAKAHQLHTRLGAFLNEETTTP